MFTMQGIEPIILNKVSSRMLVSMLGNSLTQPVVAAILGKCFTCVRFEQGMETVYGNASESVSSIPATLEISERPLDDILRSWLDMIRSSDNLFSRYASRFMVGGFKTSICRIRDVLPVPPVKAHQLREWKPLMSFYLALNWVNLTIAGVNYMFTRGRDTSLPNSVSAVQMQAIRKIYENLTTHGK